VKSDGPQNAKLITGPERILAYLGEGLCWREKRRIDINDPFDQEILVPETRRTEHSVYEE